MVNFYYGSMFVGAIVCLVILLVVYKKHTTASYVLLATSVILACFAYMQIGMAQTVETAVMANQLLYFACFLSLYFMMRCVADICKFKVPWFVHVYCVAVGTFFFLCSFSVGKSQYFYKSVDIIKKYGSTVMVKEYGIIHHIYPFYLISILLFCIVVSVVTLKRRTDVSKRTCLLNLAMMVGTCLIYGIERLFKMDIELMPVAYVGCYVVVLFQLNRIRMYDLSNYSASAIENSNEFGFILMDHYGRFEAADEFAIACFPEIKKLKIDSYFDGSDSEFLTQVKKWIAGNTMEETGHYVCGDKYIAARYTEINDVSGIIHCIRLMDETKQQHYNKLMSEYNEKLERDVSEKTQKFMRVQDDIIISMASIVENRDNNTGGHIQRSSAVVKIFVEHLMEIKYLDSLTEDVAGMIIKAAPLHDFGKIAVPDSILNKPGKFEPEEYEIMKEHSAKGAVIVARILQHSEDIMFRSIAVNIAHYHHEKWNGKGYPEGLTQKEIPFEARVMALADVFDALVSKRVYKESFDYDKAFKIIEDSAGSHFDPELCKIFLECRPSLEALYDSFTD
ncbi:MAG: HD domain-containing protein [Lachnospiraceae bacterium]|nr:HD domain-containing protein [Lachnospiraceae bacterium]